MTDAANVVVLAVEGVLPLDAGIPMQIFRRREISPYRLTLAGARPGNVPAADGFSYAVEYGIEVLAAADTIIVPGYDDLSRPIDRTIVDGLRAARDRGTRIASVCTGAFVLAAAGLLDGLRATTHWAEVDTLARRYPLIDVDPDVLFVDEGQILTSAGVAAGIDLCLHLIRCDHGVRAANEVARQIVAAPYRSGGQAQYVPRNLPQHTGEAFAHTREWALARLDEDLTVTDLAAHARVSVRTFSRHFLADTGRSPLQWLLRARIDLARELLETTDLGVDQVAARSGLGSGANLRLHFRRLLGTSPTAYRSTFAQKHRAATPVGGYRPSVTGIA